MLASLLIATKLHIPPPFTDLISRPHLYAQLDQGMHVPLTLISAPAGFGKSMLAASWIHARGNLRAAWLSLDEGDNEVALFWGYVIAAVQKLIPEMGQTASVMLSAPGSPAMQTVLGTLINDLTALEDPLVLVLDDFHLIRVPQIQESLRFFLDHLPEQMHVFLLTREDPPLGLARRRARRQLVEVRAVDLRFDEREAAEFLNGVCQLQLNPPQIASLEQRTEGWVTGLQMAALSLQGRDPAEFFDSFTGDHRYIADYLVEEVLEQQPEPLRHFLLQTSLLDRMNAELCAAIIGNAAAAREQLDTLERANLFLIPLDDRREWYRYHHLFAELLRQRLRETSTQTEIAALHRAAALWFESQEDIPSAVRHMRLIPDERAALNLLQKYFGLFYQRSALPQLFELANGIPLVMRQSTPVLCAAVAWAALASNHFEAVDEWLKSIETHFQLPADAALNDPALDVPLRAALLEVLVIRLHLPIYPQSTERVLAIRELLNGLAPEQRCLFNMAAHLKPVISFNLALLAEQNGESDLAAETFAETISLARERQNEYLFHLARGHLANLQSAIGNLNLARQTYEQALAEYDETRVSPFLSVLHAGLGALCYEWNDLASSQRHFESGLNYARLWNQWESLVPIVVGLARIQQRMGETRRALQLIAELGTPPLENMAFPLEAHAALLRFLDGDVTGSAAWLTAKMEAAALEPTPETECPLLDMARLMALLNQFDPSLALLERLRSYALRCGRGLVELRADAISVRVLSLQGRTHEAVDCLLQIIPRAAPEGLLALFIDEGESMRHLLREVKNRLPSVELRNYADRVLVAFDIRETPPVRTEKNIAFELSEREREILSLVAEGLTNQQIAERLVISITTVKTHMGNIFNKLGVTSRAQAVACAAQVVRPCSSSHPD